MWGSKYPKKLDLYMSGFLMITNQTVQFFLPGFQKVFDKMAATFIYLLGTNMAENYLTDGI